MRARGKLRESGEERGERERQKKRKRRTAQQISPVAFLSQLQ